MKAININNATRRLKYYKNMAEKHNKTWQDSRRWDKPEFLTKSSVTKSKDGKYYLVDNINELNNVFTDRDANRILGNTGWYTDNFQDNIMKVGVIEVRTSRMKDDDGAHKAYMPATYHTDWDGAKVYNKFYDNINEAARYADHYADREAEQCREDDAKYQAEEAIADCRNQIHDINKETLALIKEIKTGYKVGLLEQTCRVVKQSIRDAVLERSKLFEQIKKLEDCYWYAVY